ncbi:related to dienelactone hydrolase family protein [Rhynchosporium agropyri]|uniref:Related to dienelactone hydrolase family protein n=1 Tax=Rhynchosporium agropyri TaxID=914238 RepID=A0A1E1KXJ2_9HELO|nr:related to dienelactone hydrolase family protein [Rhynchosporium agropyri]
MTGPCADCFKGSIHTGTPSGTVATIHGIQTYVAYPEAGVTPKGLVVMITDAFGFDFVNNRMLCDAYAKKGGFLVYCPDFMNGHAMSSQCLLIVENLMSPAPLLTSILYKPLYALQALYHAIPWFITTRPSICRPRIIKFFQDLRTSSPPFETSALKIGVCGFCWGGRYTFMLAKDLPSTRIKRHESQTSSTQNYNNIEPLVDCAFTAHPSFVKIPVDAEAVTLPLSVAIGDTDMVMSGPLIRQMKEILEVKKKGDNEVVVMPRAKHGFAVRAVPDDGIQRNWADKAESQAIDWFTKYLT